MLFTYEIKIDGNITIGEITEKISGKGYNKQTLITNIEIKFYSCRDVMKNSYYIRIKIFFSFKK
ncbi:hypothetical protein HMPREF9195_01766 [Treponema medium ATCC 700293]|uniref:Uncharacterized protein n=1 Tax=Treponema medium ATCC 700293 TaxID=1125700 RepID=A0AA87NRG6_TREMD|nr:hypothetical protein HMPREF9195_01766 [Treponema medium ATCC 700293]